jgi:CBS domain-containing protein
VGAALAQLKRHRILSAPVLDPATSDVVGILSVKDVLTAFLAGARP